MIVNGVNGREWSGSPKKPIPQVRYPYTSNDGGDKNTLSVSSKFLLVTP
jgi:hypothetical protein